jgi:hypothetical protein
VTGPAFEILQTGILLSPTTYNFELTATKRAVFIDDAGQLGYYNPYGKTSSGGLAMYVNSAGVQGTTTSALRFKERIENVVASAAERIVEGLRPITYQGKDDPAHLRQYGFIAEEVDALGAKELVAYDHEGEPLSLYYERFVPLLVAALQRLTRRVEELERGRMN